MLRVVPCPNTSAVTWLTGSGVNVWWRFVCACCQQGGESSAQGKRRRGGKSSGGTPDSSRTGIAEPAPASRGLCGSCRSQGPTPIIVEDITQKMLLDVARKAEGFSGRGISKMLLNLQGAVYAEPDCRLTPKVLQQVVKQELARHRARSSIDTDWMQLHSPTRSPVHRKLSVDRSGPPGDM